MAAACIQYRMAVQVGYICKGFKADYLALQIPPTQSGSSMVTMQHDHVPVILEYGC
jgi:hypothetical protein